MSPRSDHHDRTATPETTAQVPHQRGGAPTAVRESGATTTEAVPAARSDQVRWGPVWAGALVTVPTFLVLQSLFFALGWLDLAVDGGGAAATRGVVTALLGVVAFLVGGLLAGAASAWRATSSGLLNGTLVWALGVVGLVGLAVVGGTSLLGPLAQVSGQLQVPDVPVEAAVATARHSAGWAALALGGYWAAAAAGGALGARIWPKGGHRTTARH
jgi:hypothetical protein